jgi:hypothetical protein
MKDLKLPTCKKQGPFYFLNPKINKLHGFKFKHKLGLNKSNCKQNQTKAKGKLKV